MAASIEACRHQRAHRAQLDDALQGCTGWPAQIGNGCRFGRPVCCVVACEYRGYGTVRHRLGKLCSVHPIRAIHPKIGTTRPRGTTQSTVKCLNGSGVGCIERIENCSGIRGALRLPCAGRGKHRPCCGSLPETVPVWPDRCAGGRRFSAVRCTDQDSVRPTPSFLSLARVDFGCKRPVRLLLDIGTNRGLAAC